MRTTKVITMSLPPKLARQVERIAKAENRTRSELVREALRRYIQEREERAFRQEFQAKAKVLGIETEEAVERLVDEFRK